MPARPNGWRRIGPFVGLVLAAHVALLSLPVRPAAASSAVASVALQTRTIERAAPPTSAEPAEPVAAAPSPARLPRDRKRPQVAPAPADEPLDATASAAPLQDEVPPVGDRWGLPGVADEDDLFIARSLLSVPPAPTGPVLIAYPAFSGPSNRYRGELTLFIDEQGVVVRVRAEGDPLPAELEEAARQAFMNVRFNPGELADHGAVKSRIRVEVVFEGGVAPTEG